MSTRLFEPDIIVSELPAAVRSVHIGSGDVVATGDELFVLESMKMEIPVISHRTGIVERVLVSAGDVVSANQELLRFQQGPS